MPPAPPVSSCPGVSLLSSPVPPHCPPPFSTPLIHPRTCLTSPPQECPMSTSDCSPNPSLSPLLRTMPFHKMGEDFMLDPPLFEETIKHLTPTNPPILDAFASLHNSQLPFYWSAQQNALSRSWVVPSPLWANPPFSLLPSILHKISAEGAHVLLIVPEWSPSLPALVALSCGTWLLPDAPTFRIKGAALLPAPHWRTLAIYIRHKLPHDNPPPSLLLHPRHPHSYHPLTSPGKIGARRRRTTSS